MSLNKVMLIGNVGKDPEIRYFENNSQNGGNAPKVASFTLATTERFRDRNGETRENTEWHNIVAWRQLADICEKYVKKGTQVYIEGRLRTRSWDDQNGNKRYTTEIIADNMQLLGKKSDNPASAQAQYGQQGGYAPAPQQPRQFDRQPVQAPQQTPVQEAPAEFIMGEDSDDLPF